MGRWIGIDYGDRRIGLALGDPSGTIASPAGVLAGSGNAAADAKRLWQWVGEQGILEPARVRPDSTGPQAACGFVVGLPLNMDGSDSEQTRKARRFAAELRKRIEAAFQNPASASVQPAPAASQGDWPPVEFWDERLSSFQADELLQAADLRRAVRKRLRDALAAQVILQSFLDARRTSS